MDELDHRFLSGPAGAGHGSALCQGRPAARPWPVSPAERGRLFEQATSRTAPGSSWVPAFPSPRRLKEVEELIWPRGIPDLSCGPGPERTAASQFVNVCGIRSSAAYKLPAIERMVARTLERAWSWRLKAWGGGGIMIDIPAPERIGARERVFGQKSGTGLTRAGKGTSSWLWSGPARGPARIKKIWIRLRASKPCQGVVRVFHCGSDIPGQELQLGIIPADQGPGVPGRGYWSGTKARPWPWSRPRRGRPQPLPESGRSSWSWKICPGCSTRSGGP